MFIGMSEKIGDKAALEFAVGFYDGLGAGKSIEKSFRFGCNAMHLYNIPDYAAPILKKKAITSFHLRYQKQIKRYGLIFIPFILLFFVWFYIQSTKYPLPQEENNEHVTGDSHIVPHEAKLQVVDILVTGGFHHKLMAQNSTSDFPTAVIDFKLKNPGDDSAFLKNITFYFKTLHHNEVCPGVETFAYPYVIRFPHQAEKQDYNFTNGENIKLRAVWSFGADELKNFEPLNETGIGETPNNYPLFLKSPPLPISQVVPPKGVDGFQIKFGLPKKLPCGIDGFKGYAVIGYDIDMQIETGIFYMREEK